MIVHAPAKEAYGCSNDWCGGDHPGVVISRCGWQFEADLVICFILQGYFYRQLWVLVGFGQESFFHPALHVGNVGSVKLYLRVKVLTLLGDLEDPRAGLCQQGSRCFLS